jgi:hypothetical protein
MKTTLRLFSLLIIGFITFGCLPAKKIDQQKDKIEPLSGSSSFREGSIIYGLPKTVFTVVVEMERTVERPGPYAKYASDLLGLNDVIENENEHWSIEGINVKSHEELDPSEYYVIESNTLFSTNVLALKKEGLILDLNPGIFYPRVNKSGTKEPVNNQFNLSDLGSDEYFLLERDTVYRRVNIDSSFIRVPYIVENKKRLTVDQLAEKAARRLMEMRDGKHLILTGEANVFPQSADPINEMNRLEKEYTELFTGKTWKEIRTYSYEVIPDREKTGKPVILFHFSELTGPVTGSAKAGKSVTVEFIPEQKTKDLTLINKNQAAPGTAVYDKLFYRVPDVAKVKISLGSDILFNSRKLIYQFGEVIQLPANYLIGK